MKHKGFTIVELLVVIVVTVILASISVVSYVSVREDALDTEIRSTVKTVGDAIALHEAQSESSARITVQGYPANANSIDTLKPTYLKPDYRDRLKSKRVSSPNNVLRWYNCAAVGGGFIVYASLNNPTSGDTSTFTKLRTECGHNDTQAPTTGANVYNYAQVF